MKIKTLAKIFGALFALIIVAALAAPMFLSAETLKTQLIAQVKKATGRTLKIRGKTSVTFLPDIAVSAEEVTLSNPDGFTSPYLVTLKKLQTGAKLRPLLRGELLIDGITLDGATINLETLKSGAKNWEFTADKVKESAEQAADSPSAQKKSPPAVKRFALGDVTISDSAINIIKPGAKVMALSNIDATLRGADASAPLELDGSADYRGENIKLALDIAKTKQFLSGESSPLVAELALPGGTADFNGSASMKENISAQGKLQVASSSLPKLLGWFSGNKPSGALPEQINLKGDVHYNGNKLRLNNASLRADDLQANGTLGADLSGAVPSITGALKFGTLDLDRFSKSSASSGGGSGGGGSDAASNSWSSKPVDLSALKAFNANLGLAWDKLKSGKFETGPSQAQLRINGGALALAIKQAQLYRGTATGTLRASNGGIGADVNANGIDIESLMEALSGKSRLEGKTNLTLNVNARGNNQRAWMESMSGKGSMKVRDGSLKGINIGQFLREAKQGFLFKSERESTDFSELSASYTINSGVLSNSDLFMKSPALRVNGKGSANLGARTLNYRLVPTLAGTSKGQGGEDMVGGLTIPLVLTGPWSNPSVTPDLAGMVQEGLKNPEMLKQNLQGIKDTIGDYNSADDLKRALLGDKLKPLEDSGLFGKKKVVPASEPAATKAIEPAAAAPAATEEKPVAAPAAKEETTAEKPAVETAPVETKTESPAEPAAATP